MLCAIYRAIRKFSGTLNAYIPGLRYTLPVRRISVTARRKNSIKGVSEGRSVNNGRE
jgi:hypothetical protein